MNESTQRHLLALNRRFYTEVASAFHQTRIPWSPGLLRLLDLLPEPRMKGARLSVLDVGCGNGRFAHILDSKESPFIYWGVDNGASLLTLAGEHTHKLAYGRAHFAQVDLADQNWSAPLTEIVADVDSATVVPFDFALCTAMLQHLPGYALRLQAVREITQMADDLVVLSGWQFFASERLRKKLIDWDAIDLSPADIGPGDALLPWKQGGYSVRYVHQIDEAEMQQLAKDAGLTILETFRADGRENLNLYAVCQRVG